ncbi:cell division protein SepF [Caldibacillus lycopersici]|uniref:Cell division protein SepF n=1 Tax=Perspicuibacillus lycopersici TaxID=1325689 RepID=A0AAE3IRL2_9BACI|nr:cell division protein SepF [Perspicuibacillus lycopersici]MCU9612184.1 cell division protein SepF [Perspicuibacillus lycopersici]
MGIKSKIKTWFFLDDEYEEVYEEEVPSPKKEQEPQAKQIRNQQKQNVVSIQSIQKSSKVILAEPKFYEEAQDIADHLRNRRAVVINLQQIDRDQARRIIDFISGTVYAIAGDIQRIGSDIFLCTPENVEVAGSISEAIYQDNDNTRW